MASITIDGGLSYVAITLHIGKTKLQLGKTKLQLSRVLLDTGSAATIIKTDHLTAVGGFFEGHDRIRRMVGIGGVEYVVEKRIDAIEIDNMVISPYVVQFGAMSYGGNMDAILGLDFLVQVGAIIDLKNLTISS